MGDGVTGRKPPKPKLAISRNTVFAIGACFAIVIVFSIMTRKRHERVDTTAMSQSHAVPGIDVSLLPSSYADIPPTPLSHPKVEVSKAESTTDKDALERDRERLKRAGDARRSSLSFSGINNSQHDTTGVLAGLSGQVPDSKEGDSEVNPRDNDNRQDDKRNFLQNRRKDDIHLEHAVLKARTDHELMAGTIIPGVLVTGLNSDLPGQILGQVSQNVFDTVNGKHLLVPQGTKVLGEYDSRIVYGQERLLVVWTRLIFPNGNSISLEGMPGVDLSGYSGLSDQVNNHYLKLLSGVIFSSLLGASAQVAEGRNYNTTDPQYSELAVQGVARNANDVGQQITRRNLSIQPTLEIRPGSRFNVFVNKDITLPPYKA